MPGKQGNTAATSRREAAISRREASRRDRDGWLIDAKTGALIGPDPEIERELTHAELARGRRVMGRPALPEHKRRVQVTMRWAPETIEALKASGPGWTNFAEQAVRVALMNQIRKAKVKQTATRTRNVVIRRGPVRSLKKRGTK
jgi:hypothetical protein